MRLFAKRALCAIGDWELVDWESVADGLRVNYQLRIANDEYAIQVTPRKHLGTEQKAMYVLGGTVAIIEDGKVLLTKREDFEVWCLPGGQIEQGESLAEAAAREAKEETGLEVTLTSFVGMYTRSGSFADTHIGLFAGHRIGGALEPQAEEVIDINWFDPADLPGEMFWWHRPMVADVFNGIGGSTVYQMHVDVPEPATSRQELYDLREQSELSRTEFYRYYFEQTQNQMRIL